MRCETTVETERLCDNDSGEYWEKYTLTVTCDVTEGSDEYHFGDMEIEAVDSEGDAQCWGWHWDILTSRERTEAEAGLLADYQRKAAPLKRCPHCRNVLEAV